MVDFSAPNVAKPMHVGHIRSTVIGDSLCRVLRFLGHTAISDNHIGDWGTQFGMILYGYKHFLDRAAYAKAPVQELARLYRLVRRVMEYYEDRERLPEMEAAWKAAAAAGGHTDCEAATSGRGPATTDKKARKALDREAQRLDEARNEIEAVKRRIAAAECDDQFMALAVDHPGIGQSVLAETARLHAGDAENRGLWREFMPQCLEEIQRMYRRLGVRFDHALGESFYEDRCGPLVAELLAQGIATESEGATCIFVDGQKAPMIVRKQDGAFLYATTDLATLRYRMETWRPQAILYVVDHRQSLHFEQLFAVARRMGYAGVDLRHVSFGTVLGDDGRPFKTRSGNTVGLESLLDEAVRRAREIVDASDDAKPDGPELSAEQRARVAENVGIGALKYADLSQNRTSNYVFSYDKMLAMNGNTATYMQYAYARVRSIFAKGGVDADALRASGTRSCSARRPSGPSGWNCSASARPSTW